MYDPNELKNEMADIHQESAPNLQAQAHLKHCIRQVSIKYQIPSDLYQIFEFGLFQIRTQKHQERKVSGFGTNLISRDAHKKNKKESAIGIAFLFEYIRKKRKW